MAELTLQKPLICCEIGPGSGIVISAVSKYLPFSHGYFAVDINAHACLATQKTSRANNVNVETVNMDLLSSFKCNSIDLLIFNPPYVPTDCDERDAVSEKHKFYDKEAEKVYEKTGDEKMLIKSWAGGVDGCEIINKVLFNLDNILAPDGIFYLLIATFNHPHLIKSKLVKMGYQVREVIERKIRGEHLIVLKIYKI